MFSKKTLPIWRGLTAVFVALFALVIIGTGIAEANIGTVDEALGTNTFTTVTETVEGEDLFTYKSDYTTAKDMVEENKKFAERVAANGSVLLKNTENALPLKSAADKKVTLVGKAAYSNVLGGQMGSGAANNTKEAKNGRNPTVSEKFIDYPQVTLTAALEEDGFTVNSRMSEAYKVDTDRNGKSVYRAVSTISGGFGMINESDVAKYKFDINEVGLTELEAKDAGVTTAAGFGEYKTAIVVLGRVNSEGRDYLPGPDGVKNIGAGEANEGAKDPLGLSNRERDMIKMAKDNADKVVVIINSNSPMEIPEVANDEGVDAILWIGTPGSYGMNGVVDVLTGKVNPSGKLPDTYAYDNSVSPAAQNWGIFSYDNLDEIATTENDIAITAVKGPDGKPVGKAASADDLRASAYTVYQEGIYVGYKYYETRYFDSVMNSAGTKASSAKGAKDGASSWVYKDEVLWPFGYGMSYTTFEQTLKSINVDKGAKTVTAVVNVKNTGTLDGKDAVQLYASVPYTGYDKENKIEKSAIQLLDYGKVDVPAGQNKDVTITADLSDLTSYDSKGAGTYILDEGKYYFTVGNGAHEAVNNVLAYLGKKTADGMDGEGKAANVKEWNHSSRDTATFSVSKNGTPIRNQLDNADLNYYMKDKVTYLSRENWDSTFPARFRLEANEAMIKELRNKTVEVSQDDRVSTKWGIDHKITLGAMKGVEFDDPRWKDFLEQITLHEAIHIIAVGGNTTWTLKSIQNPAGKQADGPNGFNSVTLGQMVHKDSPIYAESQKEEHKGYSFNTTPNAPILAATFDKTVLADYGKQLGNMSLWTGGPSIWAGGANQHRAPYEGRTHEYFSEDPILSAYCLLEMVDKALDYGCLVGPKHFAFNAIEYNRYGLSEFMTEQTARETELRCFQKAFESGRCLAVMTAFNRIGASYINGHQGLMQNILRREWGFKGLATTDMVNGELMFLPVETIMGGLTMMANGQGKDADLKATWVYSEEEYVKNDARINEQLKTNMHYQWYAYAHSNLMNGLNASSRVIRNVTWWSATLLALGITFGVLTAAGAALYVVSVVKSKKEEA